MINFLTRSISNSIFSFKAYIFLLPNIEKPNIPAPRAENIFLSLNTDGESIIIGGLLSNDKKQTTYKFPLLHRLPYVGEKLFTSRGVIERKTDLVIQITPKIIEDAYTGITKSKEVSEYENYVIDREYTDERIQNSKPANQPSELLEEGGE